jgi:guanidinoacetate N-methyltransferase
LKDEDFIKPPRQQQRNWILNKVLDELADDLVYLDRVSKAFIPGSESHYVRGESISGAPVYDDTQGILEDQRIMEDWQIPLMEAMAKLVTESHGDVLEVGFGRGVSAGIIQKFGVRSHVIIESNAQVAEAFHQWKKERYPDRDIRLVLGKWQDVADQLGLYDGIFFHTFPLNEQEFVEYVVNSITFAQHFFATAAAHLREGGAFTYLTHEIDSLSRRHQRLIFQHFRSFTLSQLKPLSVPANSRDLWWADSMAVVKAVK